MSLTPRALDDVVVAAEDLLEFGVRLRLVDVVVLLDAGVAGQLVTDGGDLVGRGVRLEEDGHLHAAAPLDGRLVDGLAHDQHAAQRRQRHRHGDHGRHRHDQVAPEVARRLPRHVARGDAP